MTQTITIPDGFEYVGAVLISTLWVLAMQFRLVSKTRQKANIKYPQTYADRQQEKESKDALIFNCAQRAHINTLENLPLVYLTTVVTGFHYPIYAAILCAAWVFGRVVYTLGYVSGNPDKVSIGKLLRAGHIFSAPGNINIPYDRHFRNASPIAVLHVPYFHMGLLGLVAPTFELRFHASVA
ncbi:MAPEG-domain-containing protein [Coprinopsis marcescibilis]|uniref:MAPEG-domain-containing protein n=1 Tax=Coprinopsis marcescibilis TaxID=230819 RepID=A0A5C3LDJ0_COPMA|nr:MAPEG-domain-containing protein [Coprinopsis marcescibilis]